ncbi:unnamed protein product [Cercopithifilaria johnstoni]|uniref:Uncharacterized protein n=1 Tax=Cercopithifilaria johnstoni TaxID=2874296 RepID=A0A8J2LXZ7_9BILA|nr:unnamed protein product [Cercopithifilaria johnstoni]
MHKASNSGRFRSPDGLKSSVFKAIRNVGTIAGNDSENIQCPFARIDDELEIADFRIFGNNEMNEEQKPMKKSQEKSRNEEEEELVEVKVEQLKRRRNKEGKGEGEEVDREKDVKEDEWMVLPGKRRRGKWTYPWYPLRNRKTGL